MAESSLPGRGGYEWVAPNVRTQYSLFRWSRLLEWWLMCVRILERGISSDIVSLERVSAIEYVCHNQDVQALKFASPKYLKIIKNKN